jgi:hypothetical protein
MRPFWRTFPSSSSSLRQNGIYFPCLLLWFLSPFFSILAETLRVWPLKPKAKVFLSRMRGELRWLVAFGRLVTFLRLGMESKKILQERILVFISDVTLCDFDYVYVIR